MASNDWKHELNRMLDLIEKQSTEAFEKIDEHFMALGLPFDDTFKQNVVQMANLK